MIDMLALLKRLEMGRLSYGIPCYSCGKYEAAGHTEDCNLVAACAQLEDQKVEFERMAAQLADSEIQRRMEAMNGG